jgi:hypothetical protein
MKPKISDLEFKVYSLIEKRFSELSSEEFSLAMIDMSSYPYRTFIKLVETFSLDKIFDLPPFIFTLRYRYLTELSRVKGIPRSKITEKDIFGSKLVFPVSTNESLLLGLCGFPFISGIVVGEWYKGRDKKYVCREIGGEINYIAYNNVNIIQNINKYHSDPNIMSKSFYGKQLKHIIRQATTFDLEFALKQRTTEIYVIIHNLTMYFFEQFKKHVMSKKFIDVSSNRNLTKYIVITDMVVKNSEINVKYNLLTNRPEIFNYEYFKKTKNELVEHIYMTLVLMYITVATNSNLHNRYSLVVGKPELIEQL